MKCERVAHVTCTDSMVRQQTDWDWFRNVSNLVLVESN